MVILAVTIRLHISQAESLKEKRQVLRSLIDSIRSRTRASVAETGFQDLLQRAEIGAALAAPDVQSLTGPAELIRRLVDQCWEAEIETFELQYWRPGE